MTDSTQKTEPSKLNANVNSMLGTAKETVGNLTGYQDLEKSGAKQRAEGDAEYKAAQAQGYVEGVSDRVAGKYDNVVGAVTGDNTREETGKVQHAKGKAQQELNAPQ